MSDPDCAPRPDRRARVLSFGIIQGNRSARDGRAKMKFFDSADWVMHSRRDIVHSRRATPDLLDALTRGKDGDAPLLAEQDLLIETE
jgi:hypothetical protein